MSFVLKCRRLPNQYLSNSWSRVTDLANAKQ